MIVQDNYDRYVEYGREIERQKRVNKKEIFEDSNADDEMNKNIWYEEK